MMVHIGLKQQIKNFKNIKKTNKMKKLISLIFILSVGISLIAKTVTTGPFTYPRFGTATGTTVSSDNTGAALNYRYVVHVGTLYTATSKDTIKLTPFAYETVVNITTMDTTVITLTSTKQYKGDVVRIYATGRLATSGHTSYLKVAGSNIIPQTANSLTGDTISIGITNKKLILSYVFDGVYYVNTLRSRY